MTAYQEIVKLLPQLPFEVLKDIERRTGDWKWSGGNGMIRVFISSCGMPKDLLRSDNCGAATYYFRCGAKERSVCG